MALFVAKLFESSREEVGLSVGRLGRKEEAFSTQLARCLKDRPRGNPRGNLSETQMLEWYLAKCMQAAARSEPIDCSKWTPEVIAILSQAGSGETISEILESSVLEIRSMQLLANQAEEEQRRIEAETRLLLQKQTNAFFRNSAKIFPQFTQLAADADFIHHNILVPNSMEMKISNFLQPVLQAVRVSEHLRTIPKADYLGKGHVFIEGLRQLTRLSNRVEGGRARKVLLARASILRKGFTRTLIAQLQSTVEHSSRSSSMLPVYTLLSAFRHEREYFLEETILAKKIDRFDYHFVRAESALNLIDKPEWPLRRLFEIASEEDFPQTQRIACTLAMKSREYFRIHRWSLVQDPADADADLFSLYLFKYLAQASCWKESFGDAAVKEFMQDFVRNTHFGPDDAGWNLLDAWIDHDRFHIETVIEGIKDKFEPSKINPRICNLAATVSDILLASGPRLFCLSHDPAVCALFARDCHHLVMRDMVIHPLKVHAQKMADSDVAWLSRNVEPILSSISESNVHKQLAEMLNKLV